MCSSEALISLLPTMALPGKCCLEPAAGAHWQGTAQHTASCALAVLCALLQRCWLLLLLLLQLMVLVLLLLLMLPLLLLLLQLLPNQCQETQPRPAKIKPSSGLRTCFSVSLFLQVEGSAANVEELSKQMPELVLFFGV